MSPWVTSRNRRPSNFHAYSLRQTLRFVLAHISLTRVHLRPQVWLNGAEVVLEQRDAEPELTLTLQRCIWRSHPARASLVSCDRLSPALSEQAHTRVCL